MLVTIDYGPDWLWMSLPSAYFAKFAGTALFNLSYVYLAETFPSVCRCTALALCMGGGRLGSMTAPLVFEVLTVRGPAGGGPPRPSLASRPSGAWLREHTRFFLVAAGLSALGYLAVQVLLSFELKGQALEDVGAGFARRRPSIQGVSGLELEDLQRGTPRGGEGGDSEAPSSGGSGAGA